VDAHDGPGQPCDSEGEKLGDQESDQESLPGAPNAEFLVNKSLRRLWKKAERTTREINARVLAWGKKALERAESNWKGRRGPTIHTRCADILISGNKKSVTERTH
jgi:hypothetical protein